MRVFYIIIFLLFSINSSSYASQFKKNNAVNSASKVVSFSPKRPVKINPGFCSENEHLQKDFISNCALKLAQSPFILFSFFLFLFLKNKNINAKVIIKRLGFKYWCLFKMLYPKHVFW